VTFLLTQPVTSPGGLIVKGASVSATLNGAGQFDISVYPSRSLQPAAYYQVYVADNNGGQSLLGIYDIPLSTSVINLSPYKVLDTNLAAQYTFASQAAVLALSNSLSSAVYASMTSSNVTGALGYTPLRPSLNLSDVASPTTARESLSLGAANTPAFAGLNVSGNVTTGGVTAGGVNLLGAVKAGLDNGYLPYSPATIAGFSSFLDAQEIDAADGDRLATWPDTSGNGNNATQPTAGLRPTYHSSEANVETSLPYVDAVAGLDNFLTVPIPATANKTIFAVARFQAPFPLGYTVNFDDNTWFGAIADRWLGFKILDAQGTELKGYSSEYSVLCWVQNSPTSISFYTDGVLNQTFTPFTNPSLFTSFKLGNGLGRTRFVGVIPRSLTSDEVANHTRWLRKRTKLTWQFEFLGRTGATSAPTLASPVLIIKKEGIKGKRPVVFFNHQAGDAAAAAERIWRDNAAPHALVSALVERGVIVVLGRNYSAKEGAGTNSWGNTEAKQGNVDAWNYLLAHPEKYQVDTSNVVMLGASMGGLPTALSFTFGTIPVEGAICVDCVLNLSHVYSNGFSSGINYAYEIGGAGGTYGNATAGSDPMTLAASSWAGKRWLFIGNTADSVISYTQNTAAFQTKIAGVATEATLVTTSGEHLTTIGTPATIEAVHLFLDRCGFPRLNQ
jgi:hypothetical protein